jgi:hypothetical protein
MGSMGHVVHSGEWGLEMLMLYFQGRVSPKQIHQKALLICYTELVFLHSVGSTGHVLRPGASCA